MLASILLITSSYPSQGEGASAAGGFVRDFAIELAGRGYDVTVVAPGEHGGSYVEFGVNVVGFGNPGRPLSLLNVANPLDWLKIISTVKSGFVVADKICSIKPIKHILAFWAVPCGMWARLLGRKYAIPYSVWCLGSDIWKYGRMPGIGFVVRNVLRGAEVCYADGFGLKCDVEKIGEIPCYFLASSRNISRAFPSRSTYCSPYKILYLGRWHTNKGIDIFMDSLADLADEDWNRISEVKIMGGGGLGNKVKEAGQRLQKIGRPITIGGFVDKEEAVDLIRWADFLVIPSRIESIPVVFSDAMQCGCPVIAMPVGDLTQLITTYECGLVAARCDVASFVDAIKYALTIGGEAFQPGIRNAAKLFSIPDTVTRFIETSI